MNIDIEQYSQDDTLVKDILDELADGQWHPSYKLNQRIERGSIKAKEFKEHLKQELEALAKEGVLIAGCNESYRFNSDLLESWRESSSSPTIQKKQNKPRYFGGVLEDDGWLMAKLKTYDLIHFKADFTLTRDLLHDAVGGNKAHIQVDDGLYRVFTTNGERTFNIVKRLKEEHAQYHISGMRLEKELRRRDLEDLPPKFIDDLVGFYGQFSKIFLQPYMSSIEIHLREPDDVQQQIYIWVLDAVQRYNAELSIPFAAYLSKSLQKWVFNLNRKSFGRAIADTELKHARAIADFKSKNGRDPRMEELAELLNQDIQTVRKSSLAISTVSSLRNIGSINQEDSEIPLPSPERVEANVDELTEHHNLSKSILKAAHGQVKRTKNLNGLITLYYNTWGTDVITKDMRTWTRIQKNQSNMKQIMREVAKSLEDYRNEME